MTGFGAALAYYESWLNAHPRKSEVYELIFGELSLDILRVRNAYGYDPEMVGRVKEGAVSPTERDMIERWFEIRRESGCERLGGQS